MELLVVIALLSMILLMSLPLIQAQFYERTLVNSARQFIRHAQFARQYALLSGEHIILRPLKNDTDWNLGWQVQTLSPIPNDVDLPVLVDYYLPSDIEADANGFRDPHTGTLQIIFNPAGAAKSKHGGFIANRIIMSHAKATQHQRHIILAASGRWRICDPNAKGSSKAALC